MGGGGLRILPHKSWNVYNRENKERVRRDEENARLEAERKKARAEEMEQEARLEMLRRRHHREIADDDKGTQGREIGTPSKDHGDADGHDGARPAYVPLEYSKQPSSPSSHTHRKRRHAKASASSSARDHVERGGYEDLPQRTSYPTRHVNFFANLEKKEKQAKKKEEQETDKKKELEDWQKKIGALTYLGQTVLDAKEGPWYGSQGRTPPHMRQVNNAALQQARANADPFTAMTFHLDGINKRKERAEQEKRRQEQQRLYRFQHPHGGADDASSGDSRRRKGRYHSQYRDLMETPPRSKGQRTSQPPLNMGAEERRSRWDQDPQRRRAPSARRSIEDEAPSVMGKRRHHSHGEKDRQSRDKGMNDLPLSSISPSDSDSDSDSDSSNSSDSDGDDGALVRKRAKHKKTRAKDDDERHKKKKKKEKKRRKKEKRQRKKERRREKRERKKAREEKAAQDMERHRRQKDRIDDERKKVARLMAEASRARTPSGGRL